MDTWDKDKGTDGGSSKESRRRFRVSNLSKPGTNDVGGVDSVDGWASAFIVLCSDPICVQTRASGVLAPTTIVREERMAQGKTIGERWQPV